MDVDDFSPVHPHPNCTLNHRSFHKNEHKTTLPKHCRNRTLNPVRLLAWSTVQVAHMLVDSSSTCATRNAPNKQNPAEAGLTQLPSPGFDPASLFHFLTWARTCPCSARAMQWVFLGHAVPSLMATAISVQPEVGVNKLTLSLFGKFTNVVSVVCPLLLFTTH